MNLIKELLKQTEKIDFLFPNSFDQLMNDEYYDYDKFEWFLYYVFKLDGSNVEKVGSKGKGDGGADLIVSVMHPDGGLYRIGIQAKYWKNRVGSAPINQLASAKARHNLTHLWLITTSDLTNDAKEIAESLKIKVLRADDVKDLIEKVKEFHQKELAENGNSAIEFLPIKNYKKKTNENIKKANAEILEVKDSEKDLYEELRKLRIEISRRYKITPLYNVFNNNQLINLLNSKPKTIEELLNVSGFGPVKVDKFGKDIIDYFNKREDKKDYDEKLYELLINERPKIAKYNKLKEDDVYTNQVATYLAKMKPKTKEDLNRIFNFRKENIELFGDYLIRVINK